MSTFGVNQSVRLTKTAVEKLPIPSTGQAFYRDQDLKGFGIRITAGGTRSFILEKRIEGRVRRQTIGRFGELTCEQARKQANKLLYEVAVGINPIAEREKERMARIKLTDAFSDFKKARKHLKDKTIYDYGRMMLGPFGDWQTLPLKKITRQMVSAKHRQIGEERGERFANLSMRFLSSLFNFSIANYRDGFGEPLITENPTQILSQTKAWYRTERRRTYIKPNQLPAWYRATQSLKADESKIAETVSDLLVFLLFTGLRRSEALLLTWDRVDLDDKSIYIPDPKNHEPHTLPLSDFLYDMMSERKPYAKNAFVFPGEGIHGYLVEPKKQIQKVVDRSGVVFTPHDLRRTFATIARLLELSHYSIKRLMNHKMSGDITASYIVSDVESLRIPMQRITDYFLKACEIDEPNVIAIPARN